MQCDTGVCPKADASERAGRSPRFSSGSAENDTSMSLSQAKRAVTESCPDRLYPLVAGLYQTAFPEAASEGPAAAAILDREPAVPEALAPETLDDARLLPDRAALLAKMPAGGTAAEFGVGDGAFAEEIFDVTAPETLYLVDEWDDDERRAVERRFSDRHDKVRLRDAAPLSVLRDAPADTFDWVYINSSHEYEATLAELRESAKKVKDGGVIAGDDYKIINGVIPAVHQFCAETDWQLASLTLETHGRRSYALQQA